MMCGKYYKTDKLLIKHLLYILLLSLGFLVGTGICRAQEAESGDFDWDWEGELLEEELNLGGGVESASSEPSGEAEVADGAEFDFVWDEPEEGDDSETITETAAAPAETSSGAVRGIDPAAYDELLSENLALRKELETQQAAARSEAAKVTAQGGKIAALESSLTAALNELESLRGEAQEESSALQELRKEKSQLAQELEKRAEEISALSVQVDDLTATLADVRKQLVTARAEKPAKPSIGPGSDLFKSIQQENERLKQKLVELEATRQQAQKERDKALADVERLQRRQKSDQDVIEEQQAVQAALKETIERLAEQIPAFQQQVAGLESALAEKDEELEERKQAVAGLIAELKERDRRLEKAERTARVMEKAREKVQEMGESELRDMHYNMASVYAREGRYAAAEDAYLKALRIDPSDADVHYNLGILYDDHLDNKRRAMIHYRRYLQLNPGGTDVDKVRQWLMAIELAQ